MKFSVRGYTLIELLVTMSVVAILASIAIPGYSDYVRRGARADAQLSLLEASQYLERVYSECNSYILRDASTVPPCTTTVAGLPAPMTKSPREGTQRYTLTIVPMAAQNFTIQATPLYTDDCGVFTLQSNGARGLTGNTLPADECWRR